MRKFSQPKRDFETPSICRDALIKQSLSRPLLPISKVQGCRNGILFGPVRSASLCLITVKGFLFWCFSKDRYVSFKVYLGVFLCRFSWIFRMEDSKIIPRD
ncbi:hypothetical protein OIU78_027474 [Salix suchowensis]|nr:hypothetical protein OIU78_027474 [Salix suchowensis]